MSAFSTDVRILTCPQCGAPIQLARQGGQAQCTYCHAPLTFAARDDTAMQHAGPVLTEQERYAGLWAQAANFGAKQLPPEMHQVLAGGALTVDRLGPMLGIWRSYCQRATAGDHVAGDNAVLLTAPLSYYFSATANDPQRQRALFESTMDALRDPAQKQVIRCQLARLSLKAGDVQSAQTWFGGCDPRPADLQADTAYRVTYAHLATSRNDFQNVVAALGPAPGNVPIALPSQLMTHVVRANAIEKLGDMNTAIGQLVFAAQTLADGRQSIPGIVQANSHLHLCPQSLPRAMQQW